MSTRSTSRRRALKTIASAAAAAPLTAQQHVHEAASTFVQIATSNYKPKFFSDSEFQTLKLLVDLIIPRTDTPGASDAGVHRIIDSSATQNIGSQKAWREGLAWLDATGGKPFRSSPEDEQINILRAASENAGSEGGRFFTLLKNAVVDGYYSTKEGLSTELGWNGNTYLSEFKGCTHKEHQG